MVTVFITTQWGYGRMDFIQLNFWKYTVMKAYGFDVKTMSEADCVAALMKMYQELVSKADGGKA